MVTAGGRRRRASLLGEGRREQRRERATGGVEGGGGVSGRFVGRPVGHRPSCPLGVGHAEQNDGRWQERGDTAADKWPRRIFHFPRILEFEMEDEL